VPLANYYKRMGDKIHFKLMGLTNLINKEYTGSNIFKKRVNKKITDEKIINIFFDIETFTSSPCECYAISWIKDGG